MHLILKTWGYIYIMNSASRGWNLPTVCFLWRTNYHHWLCLMHICLSLLLRGLRSINSDTPDLFCISIAGRLFQHLRLGQNGCDLKEDILNVLSCMEIVFWCELCWYLLPGVHLRINQHWFMQIMALCSKTEIHYLNIWWTILLIHKSMGSVRKA